MKLHMIHYQPQMAGHPLFWWKVKVGCGIMLIAAIFGRLWVNSPIPHWMITDVIGQGLVVLGGVISISHYVLLRNHNASIFRPATLVTHKGLYKYFRHPMYFADMIMYTGFAVIMAHLLTFTILLLAFFALFKQAREEDLYLSRLFQKDHALWKRDTKLIFPGLR